jgi:hypothetical protein
MARTTNFFVEGRERRSRLMVRSREKTEVSYFGRKSCRWADIADEHNQYGCVPVDERILSATVVFGGLGCANAAVAPKHSTLLGLAITASTTENKTVEKKIALSLIIGDRM